MGSNKRHKSEKCRETKKKRHRSRSRSHSLERESNSKSSDKHSSSINASSGGSGSLSSNIGNSSSSSRHHKKHRRKERKDYDSDVEIVDAPPPPKISKTSSGSGHLPTPPPPDISKQRSPSPPAPPPPPPPSTSSSSAKGGAAQLSLSIEETNKLRAKLGLKPLEVDAAPASKDDPDKLKDDLGEFYHKPAPNQSERLKTEKLKERIGTQRQKRKIESNLAAVKTLGESDSDDDVRGWIEKNRRLQAEKRKAEERAKALEELDEVFGIGTLVGEEVEKERRSAYTEKDLRGLKVEHDMESFEESRQVILTLKDQEVLDETGDVLVNVNMLDDERYQRSVRNKTRKPGYDAYEEDPEDLEDLVGPVPKVLAKYDEEIDGRKVEGFALGVDSAKGLRERRAEIVKQRLAHKRLESLVLSEPKLASEYYSEQEIDAKFKKPKKRVRKIRAKKSSILKADDLQPDPNADYLRDLGSRRRSRTDSAEDKKPEDLEDLDDLGPVQDLTGVKLEEDDKETRVLLALRESKAKRLKQIGSGSSGKSIAEIVKKEPTGDQEDPGAGNIVLNATAEFCRTLGDIPTYGLAGNREENDRELMDFEVDGMKEEAVENDEEEDADGRGAWNTVQIDESASEPVALEAAILDAEPSLGQGIGGALRLAMSKGYLQKEDTNRPSASRFAHLQAQNYSIEDKTYGDDDKFGRRDRFNGPTSDFKEKDGFKPNVKLEYIDDDGHVLSAKEAFRYLSHKFHGKGPGKNKVEKRMKKAEQEVLMKRMSSTDTPLGTLNLLQAKQKETQSPYIVLSGSKQMQATSISKSKH